MPSKIGKKFDKRVCLLRKYAPPRCPVSIRTLPRLRRDGERLDGYAYAEGEPIERAVILINRNCSQVQAIDALIHEWAHVLDWSRNGFYSHEEHRATWGEAYAITYRAATREE